MQAPNGREVATLRRAPGGLPNTPAVVPAQPSQPSQPPQGELVAPAEREASVAGDRSIPGTWDRFCGRATQRWPLVLGAGLALALPAALWGYLRGDTLYAADIRLDLEPRVLATAPDTDGPVPAEAIAVSELLQREAGLLQDLAADADTKVVMSSRPPYGMLARVQVSSPEGAETAAEELVTAYRARTRLQKPEQVEAQRVVATEIEESMGQARTRLAQVNLDLEQAIQRQAAGGDPAALDAEESRTAELSRVAEERLVQARSTGQDPVVFLDALLQADSSVRALEARTGVAAGEAMVAAFAGRGMAAPLRDAAASTAGFTASVADHRLVTDGPVNRRFVSISELDAAAVAASAEARAASSASGIAQMERSALQSLRWKKERIEGELSTGVQSIERLRNATPAAATIAGIKVVQATDAVAVDTRPREALFGGLLGGLLGMLGALGWIAMDDRVLRSDERPWDARGLTVLGTVPDVASASEIDGGGPASQKSQERARGDAAALADAVHAVRAMLDGRAANSGSDPDADGGRTFAVTSSGPGSGKTGLCLGLAASLASAGERVLLVDAAWADRPTTTTTDSGERQTLEAAALRMGYLHPEDVDLLTHADGSEPVGLPAFLSGEELGSTALETRVGGLSLLPAGPGPLDASRLSGRHVRRLVEAARPHYDVTLIDTSAVSVGLDALFVAAAADGVVLVVSAGERQGDVDRAVTRLRACGSTVLGTVLNRVGRPDAKRAGVNQPAAALEAGWQDQGSGMFAAAVGGASTVATRADRDAVPGTPAGAAPPEREFVDAVPAPGSAPGEEPADEDDFGLDDVLAGVALADPAPVQAPEEDRAEAASDPEEASEGVHDLDRLTDQLAEHIASGVADSSTEGGEAAGSPTDAARSEDASIRLNDARAEAFDEDAALDRLVDRHIDASLPGAGPADPRRVHPTANPDAVD